MLKLAYSLGCYEALIKLGAKLTPEQLADYNRQIALREARLPDVHIPGAELLQRPNTPAAIQMNRQTQQLLEGLPLVGGQREYYTYGTKPSTWQEAQQQARQIGAAREAELTRRLQESGRVYQRVPGAESFPSVGRAAEGTAAATPAAMRRAAKGLTGTEETLLHIAPRKVAPQGASFAKTVLRRFAHV
jgi:hypothetical protein